MKDLLKRHRMKDGETPKQGGHGEKRAAKQSDPMYDQGLLQIRNLEFSDPADM